MKMKSLRQAFLLVAIFAGTAALVASPVLAQNPPGPPVCGGVASLMNHQLFVDAPGTFGDNIVSIPSISPVNNTPANPTSNGLIDLCRRFGLTGTLSAVLQFNASSGNICTYTCDQPATSCAFTVGQAVLIRPTVGTTGRIPGVECARPYTSYVEGPAAIGDNLYPVPLTLAGGGTPLTATSGGARDLCVQLGLPAGSTVKRFFADIGNIDTFTCGQAGAAAFPLALGEGVLIQPAGTTTGTPVIF
jgi:hypothetical protein